MCVLLAFFIGLNSAFATQWLRGSQCGSLEAKYAPCIIMHTCCFLDMQHITLRRDTHATLVEQVHTHACCVGDYDIILKLGTVIVQPNCCQL
jgi:hypothetical protein